MTKEHFWTLDTASLTCFRTIYPRIHPGHQRFFVTWRRTMATGDGTRNTVEKSTGIRNRLRKRAHSPPLPSILLANVQSLENKMDDLRARISFQRDIRDCNIICLTETWLTPSVPDTAVTPSDNFSVLRMDRTAEAGKSKGGGECFMINKKWCVTPGTSPLCRVPARLIWNIYPLSAAHSICPWVFFDHRYCRLHSTTGRHRLGFV